MQGSIDQIYGNRVRVRVCGLLVEGDRILLVNHTGIRDGDWWAPPGGGVEFGEPIDAALRREFVEECGLEVAVDEFCFVCEYLKPPIHAVELFFRVTKIDGQLRTGSDPETADKKVIQEVKFHRLEDLEKLPAENLHGVFAYCRKKGQITALRGYFKL